MVESILINRNEIPSTLLVTVRKVKKASMMMNALEKGGNCGRRDIRESKEITQGGLSHYIAKEPTPMSFKVNCTGFLQQWRLNLGRMEVPEPYASSCRRNRFRSMLQSRQTRPDMTDFKTKEDETMFAPC